MQHENISSNSTFVMVCQTKIPWNYSYLDKGSDANMGKINFKTPSKCTQNLCPRPMVLFRKLLGINGTITSRAEWRGETDNRATPPVCYCPSTASFSVGHIARMPDETDARSIITASPSKNWRRPPGQETTRTSLKYVDEDYPARPEV